MSKKPAVTSFDNTAPAAARRMKSVQNFADFAGEETHKRFDRMIDSTIYIVKLEVMTSDTYGTGYKVFFKDIPGEKTTYDCAVFGQFPVQQLDNLYQMTNSGARISLDSPVRTVIRKAGNSYKFE